MLCGLLMPAVMEFNQAVAESKYARLAHELGATAIPASDSEAARDLVQFIRELKHVRIVNRQLTPLQTGKALVLGFPAIRGIGGGKGASGDSSGDVLPSPDVSEAVSCSEYRS